MLAFVNGALVPEEQARVSAFDRGYLYGDGLFETLRVKGGQPLAWGAHLQRLARGAAFLKLAFPYGPDELRRQAGTLLERNEAPDSILRLQISRGPGPRGYSPRGAGPASVIMSLHPAPAIDLRNPPCWRLARTSYLARRDDPLSRYKTCNKLVHVLARAEAEAHGADEGLLLTPEGEAAQGTASNLFWVEGETVCTPPEALGILPGITRGAVLSLCRALGIPRREARMPLEALRDKSGVFLTLSSWGIVEATELDGRALGRSPVVGKLRAALEERGAA